MTLTEKIGPIDADIAQHLIEATPEWWSSATLVVERVNLEAGFEKIVHTITNPDGHREFVVATEEICSLTAQLADIFREHAKLWKKVTYNINQNANEDWTYKVSYDYK